MVWKIKVRHRAKFRADQSNLCKDMVITRFFKMAAVRHGRHLDLRFVIWWSL